MNKLLIKKIVLTFLIFLYSSLLKSEEKIVDKDQLELINMVLSDLNQAANFTLYSINDSAFTLNKFEGKVVLLNFWATWCGPCRMEIPEFNELYNKYHEDGLEIWGISVSDSKKQLENFVKSFKVDYTLLWGDLKDIDKITQSYGGVYSIPSSFLIGRNGKIIWSYPGAILKNYDPQLFAQFVYEIDKALKQEN